MFPRGCKETCCNTQMSPSSNFLLECASVRKYYFSGCPPDLQGTLSAYSRQQQLALPKFQNFQPLPRSLESPSSGSRYRELGWREFRLHWNSGSARALSVRLSSFTSGAGPGTGREQGADVRQGPSLSWVGAKLPSCSVKLSTASLTASLPRLPPSSDSPCLPRSPFRSSET